MRVRQRQRVLPGREPADPLVRRQPREVDAQAGQDEPGVGELRVGCGPFEGGQQRTADQERREGGGPGEDESGVGHHAPSRLWPQTRTT